MLHTSRIDSNRHETKFFFEIPQKMCCRGLDIRVTQIVKPGVRSADGDGCTLEMAVNNMLTVRMPGCIGEYEP